MVLSMFALLIACSGTPTEVDPPLEPVVANPGTSDLPEGRINLGQDVPPEEVLGNSWSVTVQEPHYDDSRSLQVKMHEGQLWCYARVDTAQNIALFKHKNSKLDPKEDWVDHNDVANELIMPKGTLDGAEIHGFAWPSEGDNEDALVALSRKRAMAYERWLKEAFENPRDSSDEIRVQMPSRVYPNIEVIAHGSALTNWEQDATTPKVVGAQLVMRGAQADVSTVQAVTVDDLGSFARSIERVCNNPRDPTGENPRTLQVQAGDISCTTRDGSGIWTEVYDRMVQACGVDWDEQ